MENLFAWGKFARKNSHKHLINLSVYHACVNCYKSSQFVFHFLLLSWHGKKGKLDTKMKKNFHFHKAEFFMKLSIPSSLGENCVLRRAFFPRAFLKAQANGEFSFCVELLKVKQRKKHSPRMKRQIFFVNFCGNFSNEKLWKVFVCVFPRSTKCKWNKPWNCDAEIYISQGCWGGKCENPKIPACRVTFHRFRVCQKRENFKDNYRENENKSDKR